MGTVESVDLGRKAPGNGSGMAIPAGDAAPIAASSEGDRLQPSPSAVGKPATLAQRLLKAQEEVARLEKDVEVEKTKTADGKIFGGYKGISAAQVVAYAKGVLVKNGILYTPDIDQSSMKIEGNRVMFWVTGRFENVDDPTDWRVMRFPGMGTDKADQGSSKAYTNANKQILAKALQMTTIDAKEEEIVEYQPDVAHAIKKEAQQSNQATLKATLSNLKAAIEKATTVDEVNRLQRENKDILASDDLQDVTREYFINFIQERKRLLETAA